MKDCDYYSKAPEQKSGQIRRDYSQCSSMIGEGMGGKEREEMEGAIETERERER